MNCGNKYECICPRKECENIGVCCACIFKHRESDTLPFCMFADNDGDKSLFGFYKSLKKRFEEEIQEPEK